jgi:hypothetical protein
MFEPHVAATDRLRGDLCRRCEHTSFTGTVMQFEELVKLTWLYKGPEKPPYPRRVDLELNGEKFLYYGKEVPPKVIAYCEVTDFDEKNVTIRIYAIEATGVKSRAA